MARPTKSQRTRVHTLAASDTHANSDVLDEPLPQPIAQPDIPQHLPISVVTRSIDDKTASAHTSIDTVSPSLVSPTSSPDRSTSDYSSSVSLSEPSTPDGNSFDTLISVIAETSTELHTSVDQERSLTKVKSSAESSPVHCTLADSETLQQRVNGSTKSKDSVNAQESPESDTEDFSPPSKISSTSHVSQGKTIAPQEVLISQSICEYCKTSHSNQPQIHETSEGPITLYHHAALPGTKSEARWTTDTELILQIMRSSNMDLKILRAVDSATAIFVDGETDAGEVPVTTFFDAFPSDDIAYRKLLQLVTHPGNASLHNLAFSNPDQFYYKHKFIRELRDLSITAKFFMFGKVMVCEVGTTGRGKQICIAPQACTFPRAASVLGSIFKVNNLGFYSFKSGVTFSTALEPAVKSTNFLKGSPKKKMRFTTTAPPVLHFSDNVPLYDGRGLEFEPQNYEQLPKLSGPIPISSCAMVIFSVNSNKASAEYMQNYNMHDYPTMASLNILAAVHVLAPDMNQRKVMVNEPDDFIGVDYSSPS